MLRHLLSCTISIFLFAAFSADAQPSDWKRAAVECERDAYLAEDASQVGAALSAKAACCIMDGRFQDALDALERVPMFSLSSAERREVVGAKVLCSVLAGNLDGARAYETELSFMDPAPGCESLDSLCLKALSLYQDVLPEPKTEMSAILRGLIPPMGHIYVGHGKRGVRYAVYNLATAAFMVLEALAGNYVTGFLGGGIILYKTFYMEELQLAEWVGECNELAAESAKVSVGEAVAEDLKEIFASNYYDYVRRETGKEAGAEAR